MRRRELLENAPIRRTGREILTSSINLEYGFRRGAARTLTLAAALWLSAASAAAQTYGFATLPPGTLNHTTASAIAKVLKEKAGINMLVQPTAGDNVIIPMVARGEAEMGIANAPEVPTPSKAPASAASSRICASSARRTRCASAFWVRKDAPMQHDRRPQGQEGAVGYSAMRAIDVLARAMLATGGLTEKRHPAGAGAQRHPRRRRFHLRRGRHVLLRLRRPEGARGRCDRRRHPRARDRRERHGGGAQDRPYGYLHRGAARARSSSASRSR